MINYFFPTQKQLQIHQKEEKRRIKKQYKHKPLHLYNWNQPIRHVDTFILTVIKRKIEPHSK